MHRFYDALAFLMAVGAFACALTVLFARERNTQRIGAAGAILLLLGLLAAVLLNAQLPEGV